MTKERLGCLVACAAAYLFLDVLFWVMGFSNLPPLARPKNTFPMVAELVLGPVGILGTAVGALVSERVSGASFRAMASEAVSVAVAFIFFYRFWYLIRRDRKTDLRSAGYMVQFLLTGMVVGSLMGGLERILLTDSYDSGFLTLCLEAGLNSSTQLLFIGMPVFILLTPVSAIRPRVPVHLFVAGDREETGGLVMDIGSDVQELADVGDAVALYDEQKRISAQRSYAIMPCVEELSVLIQQRLPETDKIRICTRSSSNMMVRLQYPRGRYNPFAVQVTPGGPGANLDTPGILMMREVTAHVGYRKRQEESELTMIV